MVSSHLLFDMKIKHLNIQVQKLDIIFVSDIHNHRQYLDKLAAHVRNNSLHFDYCFVGGDVVNCNHHTKAHQEQKEAADFKEIMFFLQDLFQCKVLYIPGNHDPLAYLNAEATISPDIMNLHKKQYVLQVGLSVVGLGGSLPAYTDVEYKNKVWEGYPYQNEEQFQKDIDAVFHKEELSISKIFLTHVGPALSSTSLDRRGKNAPIFGGSKTLDKVDDDDNLLIHLHGHVHGGAKYDVYNGKPIVNPGALCLGDYAIIKLERHGKEWRLAKTSFLKL